MMNTVFANLLAIASFISVYGADWGYIGENGKDHWAEHFADCGGSTQSPINIDTSEVIIDESVCKSDFHWGLPDTNHTSFSINNNGHSIVLVPITIEDANTSTVTNHQTNTDHLASFTSEFNSYSSINTKFCFHSLHFHWGSKNNVGSEHTLNSGSYPLEAHFVHFSCDYPTLGDALTAVKYGNALDKYVLGVVGVFFEVDEDDSNDNEAFDAILAKFDDFYYPEGVDEEVSGKVYIDNLNISKLIPDNLDYYAYAGSLTTPGCNPNVRWHVVNSKMKLTNNQLDKFRDLMSDKETPMYDNYRDVQENVNPVYQCFSGGEESQTNIVIIVLVWVVIFVFIVFAIVVACCNRPNPKNALKDGILREIQSTV